MKKSELRSIIHQVIKEEMENEDITISKTDPQLKQKQQAALKKNQTVNVVDPNNPDDTEMNERKRDNKDKEIKPRKPKKDGEEEKTPIHDDNEQAPCSSCLAGKLAEIMDGFKRVSEAAKDAKHKRLAERLMIKLEAANTALEALTAHENILEEKETVGKEKNAAKHVAGVEKALKKTVKDDETVKRILDKYPISKAVKILDKLGKEPESEAVASALLRGAIKEGLDVKKGSSKIHDDIMVIHKQVEKLKTTAKKYGY